MAEKFHNVQESEVDNLKFLDDSLKNMPVFSSFLDEWNLSFTDFLNNLSVSLDLLGSIEDPVKHLKCNLEFITFITQTQTSLSSKTRQVGLQLKQNMEDYERILMSTLYPSQATPIPEGSLGKVPSALGSTKSNENEGVEKPEDISLTLELLGRIAHLKGENVRLKMKIYGNNLEIERFSAKILRVKDELDPCSVPGLQNISLS